MLKIKEHKKYLAHIYNLVFLLSVFGLILLISSCSDIYYYEKACEEDAKLLTFDPYIKSVDNLYLRDKNWKCKYDNGFLKTFLKELEFSEVELLYNEKKEITYSNWQFTINIKNDKTQTLYVLDINDYLVLNRVADGHLEIYYSYKVLKIEHEKYEELINYILELYD